MDNLDIKKKLSTFAQDLVFCVICVLVSWRCLKGHLFFYAVDSLPEDMIPADQAQKSYKILPKKIWVESKIDLPLYQPKKLILWATHIIGTTQVNQQTKTT